jgi:hypothetical protein
LVDSQKVIPERTPEKVALGRSRLDARKRGEPVAGLDAWNVRWVGPDGYQGIVARQIQEFKKRQQEREKALGVSDQGLGSTNPEPLTPNP